MSLSILKYNYCEAFIVNEGSKTFQYTNQNRHGG